MKIGCENENAVVTLKGQAMLAAIDAGMVPKAKTADGYNIKPFLNFWDRFLPALQEQFCKYDDVVRMVNEHCQNCAYQRE